MATLSVASDYAVSQPGPVMQQFAKLEEQERFAIEFCDTLEARLVDVLGPGDTHVGKQDGLVNAAVSRSPMHERLLMHTGFMDQLNARLSAILNRLEL